MNSNNKMPVVFVGHGSPMNAIEQNDFTKGWRAIARKTPTPKAILSVSAHWVTEGNRVNNHPHPKMIYDMYGFPEELYEVKYQPLGAPAVAEALAASSDRLVSIDNQWGIDHGTWSVLRHMYPEAGIPTFQLSIDVNGSIEDHYALGKRLAYLRNQGVLILGSGNVVHNLALIEWSNPGGEPWAVEFDGYIKKTMMANDVEGLLLYRKAGPSADKAFFTTEHFMPLVVIAGCRSDDDSIEVFNEECIMGSMSMTGYILG